MIINILVDAYDWKEIVVVRASKLKFEKTTTYKEQPNLKISLGNTTIFS